MAGTINFTCNFSPNGGNQDQITADTPDLDRLRREYKLPSGDFSKENPLAISVESASLGSHVLTMADTHNVWPSHSEGNQVFFAALRANPKARRGFRFSLAVTGAVPAPVVVKRKGKRVLPPGEAL